MTDDIRNKTFITHKHVLELNFIRYSTPFVFRRHFRQGLRSHIMEVIDPDDAAHEKNGIMIDGVKQYPRAKPIKMFRIFRTQFDRLENALEEIKKVKIIGEYLEASFYAGSLEFLVDYQVSGKKDILLCGLQEYVNGLLIEPWGIINATRLAQDLVNYGITHEKKLKNDIFKHLENKIQKNTETFINKIKRLIIETGYIPDLAGEGNLMLTKNGTIKLVDINNVSKVTYGKDIKIDNKGYPVIDKSIEVLWLLEKNLTSHIPDMNSHLYQTFINPERLKKANRIENAFFTKIKSKQT